MTVEQIDLEPATVVHASDPLQRMLDLSVDNGAADFVVADKDQQYLGMVVSDDVRRRADRPRGGAAAAGGGSDADRSAGRAEYGRPGDRDEPVLRPRCEPAAGRLAREFVDK